MSGSEVREILIGTGEMATRIRSYDWGRTALGPIETWPQSLVTTVNLALDSHHPMLIEWGPEFIQLYNDAYRPVLGATKHPAALGQRAQECWPEIWDYIAPLFRRALHDGQATWEEDQLFVLDRNGYPEETYFTFCYSAIRDETHRPGGVLVTCFETSNSVLGVRRLRTLRELAAHAAEAQSAEDACELAIATLRGNPYDVPFALLYLLDGPSGAQRARLMGAAGIQPGTEVSPREVDLARSASSASAAMDGSGDEVMVPLNRAWPLSTVIETGMTVTIRDLRQRFGPLPGGAWPESPSHAVIAPVGQSADSGPAGVLVCGVSPRRALDDEYRGFFELAASHIGTAISNARAHEAERQRAEALAELDRAKTEFFSNVSHEFRTPLALLLGPLQDALAEADQSSSHVDRERLEIAYRNALRLLKLVNNLLDFARIEAGRIEASYEPTNLSSLTADLASAFRSAVERAGLEFHVDCKALPEPMYVDREMWERIVFNLISNALKFTTQGEISVTLEAHEHDVELTVQDSGDGIPEAEISRIFERFHRVRNGQTRSQEGAGIGLALVRELVHLHGGEISVESEVGSGTTFHVTIPTGHAHLPPDRIGASRTEPVLALGIEPFVAETLQWQPAGDGEEQPPSADPPLVGQQTQAAALNGTSLAAATARDRVLFVDDNADMRHYVTQLLSPYWHIETAPDGESALERIEQRAPDLVLSDVMLPKIDGFALLRALREHPNTRAIPVILLSARAGEEAIVEGLGAGADDYLVKPFAARELLARVRTHLALARSRREVEVALRERDSTREQLLELVNLERQRLRAVFDQSPTFMAIFKGPAHVFEFVNPFFLQIAGRQPEDVLGRSVREAFPELARQPYVDLLDSVFRTGDAYLGKEMPVQLNRRGDGTVDDLFVTFVYSPLRDVHGHIDGIVLIGMDVTEQVRARRLVEEMVQQRIALVQMVSHDLKTPLTSIQGSVQLLQRRASRTTPLQPGQLQQGLTAIDAAARQMVRQIDELIDLARIEAGQKLPLERQLVDLVLLAREVVDGMQEMSDRHEISLHTSTAEVLGEWDRNRLHRAMSNILGNAIKYSPNGGTVSVSIGTEQSGERGWAVLEVRDCGIGIPEEEIEHIFDQFHRAPNVTGIDGTGVGLASVREIVVRHGGSIDVTSSVGVGSTFTIRLPLLSEPEGIVDAPVLQQTAAETP